MPRPWVHQTDLFRPFNDPDDHWDLACVFALAAAGRADLRGVLLDYPAPWDWAREWEPDVAAVAQLNYLYALSVPAVVGSSIPIKQKNQTQQDAARVDRGGVGFLIRTLREAPEPVVIHIVGSCRDVALAGNLEPALFTRKCAGIYLNAGAGEQSHPEGKDIEYNVAVNPAAYGAILDIPCPIYWMPCFGEKVNAMEVEEWSTYWRFRQDEVWHTLPGELRHYFAYALGKCRRSDWLSFLRRGGDISDGICEADRILAEHGPRERNMWCTGGVLHAAGYTVTRSGDVVESAAAAMDAVFEFVPVEVNCDDRGITTWRRTENATNRWIYHVRDLASYPTAMKHALRQLLSQGV